MFWWLNSGKYKWQSNYQFLQYRTSIWEAVGKFVRVNRKKDICGKYELTALLDTTPQSPALTVSPFLGAWTTSPTLSHPMDTHKVNLPDCPVLVAGKRPIRVVGPAAISLTLTASRAERRWTLLVANLQEFCLYGKITWSIFQRGEPWAPFWQLSHAVQLLTEF